MVLLTLQEVDLEAAVHLIVREVLAVAVPVHQVHLIQVAAQVHQVVEVHVVRAVVRVVAEDKNNYNSSYLQFTIILKI